MEIISKASAYSANCIDEFGRHDSSISHSGSEGVFSFPVKLRDVILLSGKLDYPFCDGLRQGNTRNKVTVAEEIDALC